MKINENGNGIFPQLCDLKFASKIVVRLVLRLIRSDNIVRRNGMESIRDNVIQ